VAVVAGTDAEFQGLATALGRADVAGDPRFATAAARRLPVHADLLDELVGGWCRTRRRSDVEAAARRHGFAAAPVLNARDQHQDAHFRARGTVEELDDQLYGRIVDYGPAAQLSATPARHKWAGRPVGWHNRHVLKGILGLPDDEIADLERRGIVGRWADRRGARPPDDWSGDEVSL
jgi:crotonobetainyl-CoA:carnitine CoA-transferase CaiB-like acyl-CoA transferase